MSLSPLLTGEAILKVDDLPRERVEVPEWGGGVLARALPGWARERWEASRLESRDDRRQRRTDLENIRASLCALCMVDEKGQRLFEDSAIDLLGQKSAKALIRVYDVAARLNGIRNEDLE